MSPRLRDSPADTCIPCIPPTMANGNLVSWRQPWGQAASSALQIRLLGWERTTLSKVTVERLASGQRSVGCGHWPQKLSTKQSRGEKRGILELILHTGSTPYTTTGYPDSLERFQRFLWVGLLFLILHINLDTSVTIPLRGCEAGRKEAGFISAE